RLHRADRDRHGRRRANVCLRGGDDARLGARRAFRAVRGRLACARRAAPARPQARPAVEHVPRPRRVRRPPRPRRRRGADVAHARQGKAARRDLSRDARAARRCAGPSGDGRRRSGRGRGGRSGGRNARVAGRSRRPLPRVPGPAAGPSRASGGARTDDTISLMPGWLIWAIVAVALALGELLTPGMFFLGPVELAAVAAGIVSILGVAAWLQLLVFIGVSVASLGVLRPIARAHVRMPALTRTGTAALVGTKAVVLQRVDANG